MNILDTLLNGNNKRIVGVSLTPGIGLEAVVLDKTKKKVEKYARRDVAYNFSTREIQDTLQFKTKLAEMMDELAVPPKTEVNVVLPNILFDFVTAPPEIPSEDIRMIVLSKAEEFYLFKKDEPISGFCEVINFDGGTLKKFAYSSFQKTLIEKIRDIITELGFTIVGVESSFSATIRGLYLTGMLDELVLESSAWSLLLVNSNSYTLFQMEGKNIVNYNDVPLAIKSFSPEEAHQAIVQGASQLLSNSVSTKLFIASQTNDVSAEQLKKQIRFNRDVVVIESNKFAKAPVMEVISANDIQQSNGLTLSSIGAASGRTNFNFTLNVLEGDPNIRSDVYLVNINGVEQEVTGAQIDALSFVASGLVGIIGAVIIGIILAINGYNDSQISALSTQISDIDSQIAALETVEEKHDEVDVNSIIDEIAELNVTAMNFYDSISTDIPKNVWLTKYYNKAGRDIVIRGVAESIIDIYEYYKNLRIISPQSDIKLTDLRVVTNNSNSSGDSGDQGNTNIISGLNLDQDKDRLYSFEISNTQIQYPSAEEEKVDENNILRKPPKVELEETSPQMTPAG